MLNQQKQQIGGHTYAVADLVNAAEVLPVEKADIRYLDKWYGLGLDNRETRLDDIVNVIRRINSADLKYPILLSYDGAVLDGKHRLTKAILLNKKFINVKIIPREMMPIPISGL